MIPFHDWILNQMGICFFRVCKINNIQIVIVAFSHYRLKIYLTICMHNLKLIIENMLVLNFYEDIPHIGQNFAKLQKLDPHYQQCHMEVVSRLKH